LRSGLSGGRNIGRMLAGTVGSHAGPIDVADQDVEATPEGK
jgi:hypothetical protein